MSKQLKYKTIKDVVLDLASEEVTMNALNQAKFRAKKAGNLGYVELIQDGIDEFNRQRKMRIAQDKFTLPEDYLDKQELIENVGFRGIDN